MKTFSNQRAGNIPEMFPGGMKIIPIVLSYIIFIMWISSTAAFGQRIEAGVNIVPPGWAPYYENVDRVHYYYLPDIECYYDVWNQEFVYLDDGNWMFGANLPPMYSWFDLDNAFVVLLDYNVFEPWRHFHYYVAHYPRYYYRSVYRDRYNDATRPFRGFNENGRAVVFSARGRNIENRSINNRNAVENRNENRVAPNTRREYPERRVESTRPPQRMDYYGKDIGQPVKVQSNMTRSRGTENRRR